MWPEERARGRPSTAADNSALRKTTVIRRFGPEDLEAAIEIDRQVFGGYDPSIFATFYEYHPRSTLVAEVGGRLAGFILGFKHTPLEGRVFWLAVKPGYQNRGIGTRLMLEEMRAFRQMGALSVILEVRVSNRRAQS
ncbi:MAG: GNAT family N-acetyltransferase, partial [Methanothrix sp.]|nr:GNAT family N-acetyltransferase [Methanothrix sp.]